MPNLPTQLIRQTALVLLVIAVTGCATGPAFVPESAPGPNEARVIAYRSSQLMNGGVIPNLFYGNKDLGSLVPGGYTALTLTPGVHQFSLRCTNVMKCQFSDRPFTVAALQAKTVYLRYSVSSGVDGVRHVATHSFVPVEASQAMAELANMRRIEP